MKQLLTIIGLLLLVSCGQVDSETLEQCVNGDTESCSKIDNESQQQEINENSEAIEELKEEKEEEESLLTFSDVIRASGAEFQGVTFGAPTVSGNSVTFEHTTSNLFLSSSNWQVRIKLRITPTSVKTTLEWRQQTHSGNLAWRDLPHADETTNPSDRDFVIALKNGGGAQNIENMRNSLPWSSTSEEILMDDVTPIVIL